MAGKQARTLTLGASIGVALLTLAGCAQPPHTDAQAQQRLAHQSVLAVNWFQQSGEYRALAHQAFNSAQRAFDQARAAPGRKKAVVVDLDETMLDNSAYSGWQAQQGQPYDGATWAKWTQAEQAGAVPGAVSFARYVNAHQGTMFYVSNRKQSEYAATVANMQKLGFTGMSEKTVLLSTDTSNKQARFDAIKQAGYDIVVYAGDNLNDFGAATYHQDNAQRRAFVSENQNKFGTEFIVLLNTGNNLVGNPTGALLILLASASWAFGSVLGSRISLPAGPMAGSAEMLVAGVVLLAASQLSGERLTQMPSTGGFLALGYLIVFGSMLAISAYMFLLKNVRPAVATSYAYVNPVVAVLLGIGFAGESLAPREWLALVIIVAAVVLVTLGKYLFARPARVQAIDSER